MVREHAHLLKLRDAIRKIHMVEEGVAPDLPYPKGWVFGTRKNVASSLSEPVDAITSVIERNLRFTEEELREMEKEHEYDETLDGIKCALKEFYLRREQIPLVLSILALTGLKRLFPGNRGAEALGEFGRICAGVYFAPLIVSGVQYPLLKLDRRINTRRTMKRSARFLEDGLRDALRREVDKITHKDLIEIYNHLIKVYNCSQAGKVLAGRAAKVLLEHLREHPKYGELLR